MYSPKSGEISLRPLTTFSPASPSIYLSLPQPLSHLDFVAFVFILVLILFFLLFKSYALVILLNANQRRMKELLGHICEITPIDVAARQDLTNAFHLNFF